MIVKRAQRMRNALMGKAVTAGLWANGVRRDMRNRAARNRVTASIRGLDVLAFDVASGALVHTEPASDEAQGEFAALLAADAGARRGIVSDGGAIVEAVSSSETGWFSAAATMRVLQVRYAVGMRDYVYFLRASANQPLPAALVPVAEVLGSSAPPATTRTIVRATVGGRDATQEVQALAGPAGDFYAHLAPAGYPGTCPEFVAAAMDDPAVASSQASVTYSDGRTYHFDFRAAPRAFAAIACPIPA